MWPVRTAVVAELWAHHTLTCSKREIVDCCEGEGEREELTVLSRLPEAIMELSGLSDMSVTSAACPLKVARSWPWSELHTFSRSSSAPYILEKRTFRNRVMFLAVVS